MANDPRKQSLNEVTRATARNGSSNESESISSGTTRKIRTMEIEPGKAQELTKKSLYTVVLQSLLPQTWFDAAMPSTKLPVIDKNEQPTSSKAWFIFKVRQTIAALDITTAIYTRPTVISEINEDDNHAAQAAVNKAHEANLTKRWFSAIRQWYVLHADQNMDTVVKLALTRRAISYKFNGNRINDQLSTWQATKLFFTPFVAFTADVLATVALAAKESLTLAIGIAASAVYYTAAILVKGCALLAVNLINKYSKHIGSNKPYKLHEQISNINPYLAKYWLARPAYRLYNKIICAPVHIAFTLSTVLSDIYIVVKACYGTPFKVNAQDPRIIQIADSINAKVERCFDAIQNALRATVGLRPVPVEIKAEHSTSETPNVSASGSVGSSPTTSRKATTSSESSITHKTRLMIFTHAQHAVTRRVKTVAAMVAGLKSRSGHRVAS